jgi:O-antigen/teichoic acid export membrane protein
MIALRFFNRAVGFVSTLILARILIPEDFGLIAMAIVFSSFLSAISDMSVHVPLIQKANIDEDDLSSAWSLNLVICCAKAFVLIIGAGWVSAFYGDARLEGIVYALAMITLLSGAQNVGIVLFQREMLFHKDFIFMAVTKLLTFIVTIFLAIAFRSYLALVAGMVSGALCKFALSYAMHPFRPRWCRSRWGEFFGFSKWLLLNNILGFLGYRGVELIIGKTMTARDVGLFSVGHEIATLPTSELTAPINRASLPGYSKLQGDVSALRQSYLDVLGLVALVVVPAGAGISVSAEVLVPLLLGEKWIDSVQLVQILSLVGVFSCLMANSGTVFLSQGKPRLLTMLSGVRVLVLFPMLVFVGQELGLIGVAISLAMATLVWVSTSMLVLMRLISIKPRDFVSVTYRPLMAALVMMLVLSAQQEILELAIWWDAIVQVFVGVVVYLALIVSFWGFAGKPPGAETRLWSLALSLAAEKFKLKVE